MSSPLSEALKGAVESHKKEEEKRKKNRAELAMERTAKRVEDEINQLIEQYTEAYYTGYTPKVYSRTDNLRDSGVMKAYTEEHKSNGYIGFEYGAEFDAGLMDHSTLTLWPGRIRKRDGQPYTYPNPDVDEEKILEQFRIGNHPNTGVNTGSIWGPQLSGEIPKILRAWGKSGRIKKIFLEEFYK